VYIIYIIPHIHIVHRYRRRGNQGARANKTDYWSATQTTARATYAVWLWWSVCVWNACLRTSRGPWADVVSVS